MTQELKRRIEESLKAADLLDQPRVTLSKQDTLDLLRLLDAVRYAVRTKQLMTKAPTRAHVMPSNQVQDYLESVLEEMT